MRSVRLILLWLTHPATVLLWALAVVGMLVSLRPSTFVRSYHLTCGGCGWSRSVFNPPDPAYIDPPTFASVRLLVDEATGVPTLATEDQRYGDSVAYWTVEHRERGYPAVTSATVRPYLGFWHDDPEVVRRAEAQALVHVPDIIERFDPRLGDIVAHMRAGETRWTVQHAGAATFNFFWWTFVVLTIGSLVRGVVYVFGCLIRLADYGTRRSRLNRSLCPTCKYDLRGLPSDVCPECGTSSKHPVARARG
ncbi:MAG: hypothetical protein KDA20_04890 [Phycisphaerales bacterium]|nr:hypothetical protein [Phycisphaerales bacterium]